MKFTARFERKLGMSVISRSKEFSGETIIDARDKARAYARNERITFVEITRIV